MLKKKFNSFYLVIKNNAIYEMIKEISCDFNINYFIQPTLKSLVTSYYIVKPDFIVIYVIEFIKYHNYKVYLKEFDEVFNNTIFVYDVENIDKFNYKDFENYLIISEIDLKNTIRGKINKDNKSIVSINSSHIAELVSNKLLEYGFSTKYVGFNYIKKCIIECLRYVNYKINLKSDVYLVVSSKCYCSLSSVERNIRTLILNNNSITSVLHKYPTNKEVISFMVDVVKNAYKKNNFK